MEHNLGKNIAELRKSKGWTQATLAEKLNISDKAVSKWESGFDLYPESWTFFKRDSVISGIELDS